MNTENPVSTPCPPVEKEPWEPPRVLSSAIATDTEYYGGADDRAILS
jgi:hypothetical protein